MCTEIIWNPVKIQILIQKMIREDWDSAFANKLPGGASAAGSWNFSEFDNKFGSLNWKL